MTLPGFTVTEIGPIEDNGERWLGLQAHFPDRFASHRHLQGVLLRQQYFTSLVNRPLCVRADEARRNVDD
jgi:hypothetical protein